MVDLQTNQSGTGQGHEIFGRIRFLQMMPYFILSVMFFGLGRNSVVLQNTSNERADIVNAQSPQFSSNIAKSLRGHGVTLNLEPTPPQKDILGSMSVEATPASVSQTSHNGTAKTKEWYNWPAVAYEESGHSLVFKGDSFFNHARELYFQEDENGKALLDEFLELYKNRPDPVNMCGIRINHAMALFLAVKEIKPSLVIESGVNAGVSTYFIRGASSSTKIFAIDPLAEPICGQKRRWIDKSDKTTYYTGDAFVDLMDLDWKGMKDRKEIDPQKTLVFIDDHLHAFKRIAGVMKHGVRHVVVEDNYKLGEGATPNDKISTPKQMFYGKQWAKEGNWLFANIKEYAEFPPIIPPIMAKAFTGERKAAGGFMVATDENTDIVHPMLRPDLDEGDMKRYEKIASYLDIDPTLEGKESYMQFMNYNQICHLELFPVVDN